MTPAPARTQRGFTLLELSIVLAIIGVILSGALAIVIGSLQATQYNKTVERMDAIEKALLSYAIASNRIPCPSDLTLTTASAVYGLEAGASAGGTATGECVTGMTPAANFKAASGTEEGGVPTRALQLPDDTMYDGWGRKFRYAVDPTVTASNALPASVYSSCSASATAITVNDATGAARTTNAAYALISHGANGHGAYTSNGVVVNAGSVNTDEQTNCHCNSSAASTTYTPTYIEKTPTQDSSNALDNFDDIVTFKEGWQMQAPNFALSQTVAQCLYVADLGNNRVEIFNTKGSYVGQFGSVGSGNGQFSQPNVITTDTSGNVYVGDYWNARIEKFSSTGTYLSQFGNYDGHFTRPQGLAVDASGNVWVSDEFGSRVAEYNSSGTFVQQFPCASGICTPGSGNGQLSNYLWGIAFDAGGNIHVLDANNQRVEVFQPDGTYVRQYGAGGPCAGGFFPTFIAFDASGNADVVDDWCVTVQKWNSSGTYVSQFGGWGTGLGQFKTPEGIAIDASGNVWVASYTNNNVQEFDKNGTALSQFGSSGSGNGQFNGPGGIAVGGR